MRWPCPHRISQRWPDRLCGFPAVGGPDVDGPRYCVRHLPQKDRTRLGLSIDGDVDAMWFESDLRFSTPACWSWLVPTDPVQTLAAEAIDRLGRLSDSARSQMLSPESQGMLALTNWQDGCCAVCSLPASAFGTKLVTDHCHTSGLIRGLLCQPCNTKEGNRHNDEELIEGYRQLPPTRMLGVRLRYYDLVNGFTKPLGPEYGTGRDRSLLPEY